MPSLAEPQVGVNSFPPVLVTERDLFDAELVEQADNKIARVPAEPGRQHQSGLGEGRSTDSRRGGVGDPVRELAKDLGDSD